MHLIALLLPGWYFSLQGVDIRKTARQALPFQCAQLTLGDGYPGGYAVKPPSIVRLAPVTKPASGPARYATSAAISSAAPYRGRAISCRNIAAKSLSAG